MDIIRACTDPKLFGPWFKPKGWFKKRDTWASWFSFLHCVFGLSMTESQLATFRECTGLTAPPDGGVREAWLIVGRRGGKSLILAAIAAYLATLVDWSRYLNRGERGVIMVAAADREQAKVLFRYIREFLATVKALAPLIERETADSLDLSNGISIEVATASFKSIRGRSVIAFLADEVAFWQTEGSNPDAAVMAAIRPAMATIPNAMLLVASSPYSQRGELWNAHQRYYGKPGNVMVWKASTKTMNPSIPDSVIAEAYERDPASAAAEFGADFRTDVGSFIDVEMIDACTISGRYELPPGMDGAIGFADMSGGVADSHCCAVAWESNGVATLACLRELKGSNTESVVEEFAELLKRYGLTTVFGDRYGQAWVKDAFARHGIELRYSPLTRSELYLELLPGLRSRKVELLDLPKLRSQLMLLERRTSRTGKDIVDHPPGAHDDLINAAAGALVMAAAADRKMIHWHAVAYDGTVYSADSNNRIDQSSGGKFVVGVPMSDEQREYEALSGLDKSRRNALGPNWRSLIPPSDPSYKAPK
ncbi:MAG: hypothetical protein ACLPTZ_17180 [Beijerinckiaceae bacterium]